MSEAEDSAVRIIVEGVKKLGSRRRCRKAGPVRILVDLVHTYENNPVNYHLNKCTYEYYNSYSVFRLFRIFSQAGIDWNCVKSGLLTKEVLAYYDVLFINLIHEQMPHFTREEISAIHQFVDEGGGLFVICEHTNAYHGAEKINPLIIPLGIELLWATALDNDNNCTVSPGWILVTNLDASHPVNEGVSTIHMKSAAPLKLVESKMLDSEGRFPRTRTVASLSQHGWADQAGTLAPDFYGDGKFTPGKDERGAFPVCATSEFGLGKVFVIGDQNIHGDAWLHFRHNFRQVANSIEWLCEPSFCASENPAPSLALSGKAHLRDVDFGCCTMGVDTRFRPYSIAKQADNDYYSWFCNFNRDHSVTARAVSFGDRELSGEASLTDDDNCSLVDVLFVPSPTKPVPQREVDALKSLVWAGKVVVLLMDVTSITDEAIELLYALVPSFQFNINKKANINLSELELTDRRGLNQRLQNGCSQLSRETLRFAKSEQLELDHLHIQDIKLADITSSWGKPFLQTDPNTYNAALGCLCVQSSDHDVNLYPARHAVDGNYLSSTQTAIKDKTPWIEIDLGLELTVQTVCLHNRADEFQSRFRDLVVELSRLAPKSNSDKRESCWASAVLNPQNNLHDPTHINVKLPPNTRVRFVRVSRNPSEEGNEADRNVLSVGQIQVIAVVNSEQKALPLFNVAQVRGVVASQSSDEGGRPATALELNWDTCTHTQAHDRNAWWKVDLKKTVDVRVVHIINRTKGWQRRLRDIAVSLYDGREKLIHESPLLNPGGNLGVLPQISYAVLQKPCFARYVKVSRRSMSEVDGWTEADCNVLSMAEVQVLAIAESLKDLGLNRSVVDIARIGPIPGGGNAKKNKKKKKKAKKDEKKENADENEEEDEKKEKTVDGEVEKASASSTSTTTVKKEGALIVFLQDRFWWNNFLNDAIDHRPRVAGHVAVHLQYAVMDFLKQRAGFAK